MSGLSWDGTYPYVEEFLRRHLPERGRLLDVGAGQGRIGYLARFVAPGCHITGIEVWQASVRMLREDGVYDEVIAREARAVLHGLATSAGEEKPYDVITACDFIEHLEPAAAGRLLEDMRRLASVVILTCPLGEWPQEALDGNEREVHRWSPLPSWFLGRGCREAVILSAAPGGRRYGLHADLDAWVEGGAIPQAIGVFLFR